MWHRNSVPVPSSFIWCALRINRRRSDGHVASQLGPSPSSFLWCAPRMNRRRRIGLVGQKPMP